MNTTFSFLMTTSRQSPSDTVRSRLPTSVAICNHPAPRECLRPAYSLSGSQLRSMKELEPRAGAVNCHAHQSGATSHQTLVACVPVPCLQQQQWLWQQTLEPSLNGGVVQCSRSTFAQPPTVRAGIYPARFPTTNAVANAKSKSREQERILASASNRPVPAFFRRRAVAHGQSQRWLWSCSPWIGRKTALASSNACCCRQRVAPPAPPARRGTAAAHST